MNGEYLSADELKVLGLVGYGSNVSIHKSCVIPNPSTVKIGSNTRIDAFTVLSASHIEIGSYVHLGSHVSIVGQAAVIIGNFCGLSHGSKIFSSTDDLAEEALTNPMVGEYGATYSERVHMENHAILGAGSTIMPGVKVGMGAIIGAMSYVINDAMEFIIYGGVPAHYIKPRPRNLLNLERKLLERLGHAG